MGAYLHTQSKVRERVNAGSPALSQGILILNSGNVNSVRAERRRPSRPRLRATELHRRRVLDQVVD